MIQCKCIQKFRNKQGKIYGYRLIDINNQTQDVTPDDLKKAILSKQINVLNLTLTSDNRLIDKQMEQQLQNKTIMPNNVEIQKSKIEKFEDMCESIIEKIDNGLGSRLCVSGIDDKEFRCYCMGDIKFKYPEAAILDVIIKLDSMTIYMEGYDENGLLNGGRANEIHIEGINDTNIELAIRIYKELKHKQLVSYKNKIKICKGKIVK